jgi:hypothetical protein
METDFNKKLITAILKNIPGNIKPVAYLTGVLGMSRESAYRRIRNDIPFTTEELGQLASKLSFSVDNIIEENNLERAFFEFYSKERDPVQIYLMMLEKFNKLLEEMLQTNNIELIIALNGFPPTFRVFFNNLFKFTFYKWLHQSNEFSLSPHFSSVTLPDDMIRLQKKIKRNMMKIDNSVLILDPNVFSSLAKDIQYYYQRKLLDEADFYLLKDELKNMIDLFETIARTGVFDSKSKISLYLSSLHINANTAYFSYGETVKTMIWVFTVDPIIIQNLKVSARQKKWLLSLRRQSTLISQSNEILQAEFFDRQRKEIEGM